MYNGYATIVLYHALRSHIICSKMIASHTFRKAHNLAASNAVHVYCNVLIALILCLATTFALGCSRVEPLKHRGPVRWWDLPPTWVDPFSHLARLDVIVKPSTDGWVYFMPIESAGFNEVLRILGRPVPFSIDPDAKPLDPPAIRLRGSFTQHVTPEQFASAPGEIIEFANAGPLDRTKLTNVRTPVTVTNSTDPGRMSLSINGQRIDMGYPALKVARPSPDGRYYVAVWCDNDAKSVSLGGASLTVYLGNEYLHLIDAQTGQSLGAPVMLEDRTKGLCPWVVWSMDSQTVVVMDEPRTRVWFFSLSELQQPPEPVATTPR